MLDLNTLNDVFLRAANSGKPDLLSWREANGTWQPISARQLYHRVRALANAFAACGIAHGDRIAILSENRWEWAVTDFATLALGAVDVPLYPSLTPGQIAYMLRDSGARIAVVSSLIQYQKVASVRDETRLEHIVLMDSAAPEAAPHAVSFASLLGDADLLAQNSSHDPNFEARLAAVQPSDLATLIYTSGTTGDSKGVMLTHGNIAQNINYGTHDFSWNDQQLSISFLPLSHITARMLDYSVLAQLGRLAYCSQIEQVAATMREVHPTIFVGVPRVYEKIRQAVEQKALLSPVKAKLFRWALRTGAAHRAEILAGKKPSSLQWKLANKLVLSKISEAFGGRVSSYLSGGAPLGLDTGNWFADAGIRVCEGYGLTETSPVIALNSPVAHRLGSVGKILPNLECKIAADGELLVRGPSVFSSYWNKPDATAEAFEAAAPGDPNQQVWFRTGDIARIDDDGFLFITDRKKELLKTSGGKFIAPQPIENKLKANLLVAQAALVGDRHKFASVILAPNFPALEEWAKAGSIAFATREQLVAHPSVLAEYQSIVDKVNGSLAKFESIKRLRLVPDEWTIETGELTPSMKLKRRIITQKYAHLITGLYADESTATRETVSH